MSILALTMVCMSVSLGVDEVPSKPASINVVTVQGLDKAPAANRPRPGIPATSFAPSPGTGNKAPRFGPGLEDVKKAIEGLDYKAFRRVAKTEKQAAYSKETPVALNERYTLYLQPIAKDGEGRVRMKVRVEMAGRKRNDKPINVISDTTVALVPNRKFNLSGLKLDEGELIVVLWTTN